MSNWRSWLPIHLLIVGVWFIASFVLLVHITMLGNEEQLLAKSRGLDLKARTDMAFQVDRLRSQLDVEASAPALDTAIRTIGLQLQPQPRLAELRPRPVPVRLQD